MKKLSDDELKSISGGGVNIGLWTTVIAGVTFLIGLIDGMVRPFKCN